MLKIVTHPHLDVDAASSVGLLILQGHGRADEVGFVPANADKKPPNTRKASYVDHPLGVKGKASALAELPGSRETFGDDFVSEVAEQDSKGKAEPRLPLGRMFAAVRAAYRARGMSGEAMDRALLEWWLVLLEGLAIQEDQARRAEKDVVTVPITAIGGRLWAIPDGPMPPQSGIVLNERLGVTGFLYQANYGLGVYRFPGRDRPNLNRLKGALPGWFIHPEGFLACWGSRKAPRVPPPPKGTPQNKEELLAAMRAVFQQPHAVSRVTPRRAVIRGWPPGNSHQWVA